MTECKNIFAILDELKENAAQIFLSAGQAVQDLQPEDFPID